MLQGKVDKVLDCGKNGKSGKGSIYNSRYICNDRVSQCSPKSHSLKRRSSSSAPSGPISYGFDRIKLHQVQVMSPVLLIHLSLRSSTQVLERIIQLPSAWKQLLERILVLLSDVVCVCVSKDIQDCKTMRNFPDPEAARLCNSVTLAVKIDLLSPCKNNQTQENARHKSNSSLWGHAEQNARHQQ